MSSASLALYLFLLTGECGVFKPITEWVSSDKHLALACTLGGQIIALTF